jgi:drug/metabolite transporter (DMT)-like permease
MRLPQTPWKVALLSAAVVLVVGIGASALDRQPEESGELTGCGAVLIGCLAYAIAWARSDLARPPWKIALLVSFLIVLAGLAIGTAAIDVFNPGGDMKHRHDLFADGLAKLSIFVFGLAYFIAWRRAERAKK